MPTSTDGNCGANSDTHATCLNSEFGDCCSEKGFCGSSSLYCGVGCQKEFGTCNDASDLSVSTTGTCGDRARKASDLNVTCLGSEWGDCCSGSGYCGGNATYCGEGCQGAFGNPENISLDGNCGANSAVFATCLGSSHGDCCSHDGFCGRNASTYCGAGCQPEYGHCDSATTPWGAISVDGNCGPNSGVLAICTGSQWGDCCSGKGFCGGNSSYCGVGCQSEYGGCGPGAMTSPSPSASPAPGIDDGGLSTGAMAGIGVGAGVAGCALVGFAAWFAFFRRRRAKGANVPLEEAAPRDVKIPVEMASTTGLNEMDGKGLQVPVELPTR
ncbi:uncharacterized protein BJX67DRAFT_374734 [Aspergillus lucknowensis]|uniref:Chitin-binding type-1 domain-containing protein n=1 Tax=Aspergillus lucknowensis TaxID=176173 RepID=A0ABR4LFH7_9EURO